MLWMLWFLLYQEIKKVILKMASFLLNVRLECLYLNWLLHKMSWCCFEHFVSSMHNHGPHCGSWQKWECWSSWFYCCVVLSCVNSRVNSLLLHHQVIPLLLCGWGLWLVGPLWPYAEDELWGGQPSRELLWQWLVYPERLQRIWLGGGIQAPEGTSEVTRHAGELWGWYFRHRRKPQKSLSPGPYLR